MASKEKAFIDWLRNQSERDDLIGDLADDFQRSERTQGITISTKQELEDDIQGKEEALKALEEAWKEFNG